MFLTFLARSAGKAVLIFSCYLCSSGIPVYGQQKFTISGYVKDASSGEALVGANVYDTKSFKGVATNQYGFYSLTLENDSLEIAFSYVGFITQKHKILNNKNQAFNVNLLTGTLDEVVISGQKATKIEESTQMSSIDIPIQQIKALPALLGEVDVLKVISLMPGVQSGNEGTTGLYVRGGSPDQNLILLDGVPLYYVSHLGGFFSVFNADAISNVNLIKGGFPARYGGRLSSVIDIKMKEGNMKEFHGEGSIGPVSSKLSFQGPIFKDKTSFIVSGRRTFLDLFTKPLSKNNSDNNASMSYYFYDLNAKINHILSDKDRLYLSFYSGDDRSSIKIKDDYLSDNIRYSTRGENKVYWGNVLSALRWNHVFSDKLFSNMNLNYTKYRFLVSRSQRNVEDDPAGKKEDYAFFGYNSGIEDLSAKIDFDFYPSPDHSFKYGLNAIYHTFRPGVSAIKLTDDNINRNDTTFGSSRVQAWEASLYVEDDWEITPRIKANIGIHFSTFLLAKKQYYAPQPRIAVRYLTWKDIAVKASYSSMQQYLHLLSNSDAGLPTDLWVPATDQIKPQWSQQVGLGLAKSVIDDSYELSLEGYYKEMKGLIEYKEGTNFFGNAKDWQENVETGGKGTSYGVEFLIQKKVGRLTGWLGYTWSRTYRQFENLNFGKEYPYKYDRRHDIGIAAIYKISESINFSANWVYGTGNAVTLSTAKYPVFMEGSIPTFEHFSPNLINVYEGRNGFRMRSYHRLDFNFSFIKKKRWGERSWNLGAYNAYSRRNPYFYFIGRDKQNYPALKQFSLFPVLPFISYSFKF